MEDNPMKHYVGLDISNKETSICIVNESGNIVKEVLSRRLIIKTNFLILRKNIRNLLVVLNS